jgi:hypothetical protein
MFQIEFEPPLGGTKAVINLIFVTTLYSLSHFDFAIQFRILIFIFLLIFSSYMSVIYY